MKGISAQRGSTKKNPGNRRSADSAGGRARQHSADNGSYQNLGRIIRRIRLRQELTLQDLAKKTGLALSFISQVERGVGNPTLASLKAISDALGVAVGHFFDQAEPSGDVVRAAHRKRLIDKRGVTHFLLTSRLDRRFAMFHTVHEPRKEVTHEPLQHEGEEAVYVLKGTLELMHRDERYVLKKGDSIYFSSRDPHSAKNVGRGVLECIWVESPHSF